MNLDIAILALTFWNEGGSTGSKEAELRAMATTVFHRMRRHHCTATAVVLAPNQYSCWNGEWLNGVDAITQKYLGLYPMFHICFDIANSVVNGSFQPTGPWDHYWNPTLCTPSWAPKMVDVVDIGRQRFGREV
jgi:hypothetical protein